MQDQTFAVAAFCTRDETGILRPFAVTGMKHEIFKYVDHHQGAGESTDLLLESLLHRGGESLTPMHLCTMQCTEQEMCVQQEVGSRNSGRHWTQSRAA